MTNPLGPNPFAINSFNNGSTTPASTTGLVLNSTGTGGATGATNGFLASASIQMFRTVPVPNRLANLFSLHCRKKNTTSNVTAPPLVQQGLVPANLQNTMIYNFPISPSGYTRTINAVTTRYMTKGQNTSSKSNQGQVSYLFDEYGYSPPSFLIEGTTGWKYHTLDGGNFSGYQSFHNLQKILKYFYDNNANITNESDRYVLSLYDYYNQSYWEVEPVGNQIFSMQESAPLNGYYRLYFEGSKDISKAPSTLELQSVLDQVIANAIVGAANTAASAIAPFVGVLNDALNISSPLGS